MIDQNDVVWVHCPPESPEAPPKTALYQPIKFRAPVICQFRQRHPDLSISQQVAKLQENYCWTGMKQELLQHPYSCANCAQLKLHQQKKTVPNAVVHLDIHGPFPSYCNYKFVAVFTDEATRITSFAPMTNKTAEDLAEVCFTQWVCKMSVPQVIDTNLSEDQAEALKHELDIWLNQDVPNNPLIDANRNSCFNQQAADSLNRMVNAAELSWEDFLPALNFAHNTSYQSTIGSTPFEMLYGYKPEIPTNNLEALTSLHSFATERMKIFKDAIAFAKTEADRLDKETLPQTQDFSLQQTVLLFEKSNGQTLWTPVKIVHIHPHKIGVSFSDKRKERWIKDLTRLRPLTDFNKEGEGYVLKSANMNIEHTQEFESESESDNENSDIDSDTENPGSENKDNIQGHGPLIEKTQRALIRSLRTKARQLAQDQQIEDKLISALGKRRSQPIKDNQDQAPLINLIDVGLRPYILGLSYKLCINEDLDFDPFTPEERSFWELLDPQERNFLLTANPFAIPEYRTELCIFHKGPQAARAAPAPLMPDAPGPSEGSRPSQPVPLPLPSNNPTSSDPIATPGPSSSTSHSSQPEKTTGQKIQKFGRKLGSGISLNLRSSMK